MDISVVILSWNDKSHLEGLLKSLDNSTKTRSMEIIVVDNASTDGSPEMVASDFPAVNLIRNKENLGFPKGNNVGITASRGKYIYILNSDIKVLDGCIDALADYLDQNPKVGMVGPKVLNGDMTHQSSCRRFPTLWNNFCEAAGLAKVFPTSKMFCGEHMSYFKGNQLGGVDVLVGCFWTVRREALDEVGLLDEGFFIYAEDVDWCKRFWEGGWRVDFCPAASAIHYRGASTVKKDPVRFALTQQRSILRYWKKHHNAAAGIGVRSIIFIHKASRWAAALVSYLVKSSGRKDSKMRMDVAGACLRDLFSRHHGQSTGAMARGNTVNPAPNT